ncbi:hypothetical protein ABKN59_006894 [Abortiporus biennis]
MSDENWEKYDHYLVKLEDLKAELKCQPDDKEELREEQTYWVNKIQQKLDLACNAYARMEQIDRDILPVPEKDKEVAVGMQIVLQLKNVFELQDLAFIREKPQSATQRSVGATGQESSPSQLLSYRDAIAAVRRRKYQIWKAAQKNEEEEVDQNSKMSGKSGIEDSLPSAKHVNSSPKTGKQGKNQKALRGGKLVDEESTASKNIASAPAFDRDLSVEPPKKRARKVKFAPGDATETDHMSASKFECGTCVLRCKTCIPNGFKACKTCEVSRLKCPWSGGLPGTSAPAPAPPLPVVSEWLPQSTPTPSDHEQDRDSSSLITPSDLDAKALQSQIETLELKNEGLECEIGERDTTIDTLSREKLVLKRQVARLERDLAKLRSDIGDPQRDLERWKREQKLHLARLRETCLAALSNYQAALEKS